MKPATASRIQQMTHRLGLTLLLVLSLAGLMTGL